MKKETSTERVKKFQENLEKKGFKEVRGAYAQKDDHPEIKKYVKKNYGDNDEDSK